MAARDPVEQRVDQMIQALAQEFAHLGKEMPWTVARALLHRTVHFAAEGQPVDFCVLATYLGDMIGHAHRLAHGDDPRVQRPSDDFVH